MVASYAKFLLITLGLSCQLWAHEGPVNEEGCHKNTHNDVFHCHKGKGTIQPLPGKDKVKVSKKIEIPDEFKGVRSVATIQQTMSDTQRRLLEFECCVGESYLNKGVCESFGFKIGNVKKDCAKNPADLSYDLSQDILKKVRCYECCSGEELLGNQYCANRGFKNWNKGKNCGCK